MNKIDIKATAVIAGCLLFGLGLGSCISVEKWGTYFFIIMATILVIYGANKKWE